MNKKNWIKLLQEAYPKARPYVATALVIAVTTAPAIPNQNWRIGVTAALSVTLLFLIFDLFNNVNRRLDGIDNKLKEEEPPTFINFTSALPTLKAELEQRLKENRDIRIRILGVAAQFSWKNLIQNIIPDLLKAENKDPKIVIEILLVDPEVLIKWGQRSLAIEAKNTIDHYKIFKQRNKSMFDNSRLSMSIWKYDNIPHWHGVLVDEDMFFMGRCKWRLQDDKYYDLEVGQKEYRLFRTNDRFRGSVRIEMFDMWFDAYKFRSEKNKGKIE